MTTTTAPRRSPSPTAAAAPTAGAPPSPSSPEGPVEDVAGTPANAAATFTPAASSAPKRLPFDPPASPVLLDETKAADPQAARAENSERIDAYRRSYDGYLARMTEGISNPAVSLDAVKRLGPPVSFAPTANLPVKQRAQYDSPADAARATPVEFHEALGARMLEERGIKSLDVTAFYDVKATLLGNGVRVRHDDQGTALMRGAGASNGLVHDASAPGADEHAGPVSVSATYWTNVDTGEGELQVSARGGAKNGVYAGIEHEGKSQMTEAGIRGELTEHVGANVGIVNGTSGDDAKLGLEAGAELFAVEVEGKVGGDLSLASTEYIKAGVDSKGFYGDDKKSIAAHRSGGR